MFFGNICEIIRTRSSGFWGRRIAMEKIMTVVGTLMALSGIAQGLSLSMLIDPPLSGIIGGAYPVVAGALASLLFCWKKTE